MMIQDAAADEALQKRCKLCVKCRAFLTGSWSMSTRYIATRSSAHRAVPSPILNA